MRKDSIDHLRLLPFGINFYTAFPQSGRNFISGNPVVLLVKEAESPAIAQMNAHSTPRASPSQVQEVEKPIFPGFLEIGLTLSNYEEELFASSWEDEHGEEGSWWRAPPPLNPWYRFTIQNTAIPISYQTFVFGRRGI